MTTTPGYGAGQSGSTRYEVPRDSVLIASVSRAAVSATLSICPFSEGTMVPPSCGQAAFIVRSESWSYPFRRRRPQSRPLFEPAGVPAARPRFAVLGLLLQEGAEDLGESLWFFQEG